MMRRSKIFAVTLALAMVFMASQAVFAGGGQQKKTDGTIRIGFINAFLTTPYQAPLDAAAVKRAKELGVELILVDGKADSATMLSQAQSFIDQKVDAIMFVPADMPGSVTIVKAIAAAGIPVIGVNSRPDPSVENLLATQVSCDLEFEGEVIGKLVASHFPQGGKAVTIEGFAGTEAQIKRTAGFKKGLATSTGTKVEVVQEVIADWDRAKAMAAADDLITRIPDLKVIFAQDDSMAFGAIEAVKAAGKMDQISVYGIGFMGDESRAYLKSGELKGTCTQSPSYEGVTGLELAVKVIKGEKVDSYYRTEAIPVSKDNADSIDHGFNVN